MINRKPYISIWNELSADKSMVLLAGPRQCGKTTLAKMLCSGFTNSLYFNWDILTDKQKLIEDPYFFQSIVRRDKSEPLVILDEIHKYKEWKNYLKGVYDKFNDEFHFLISGSGRLDLYQKGGDSLAGRYYLFHLWPLTLSELNGCGTSFAEFRNDPTNICTENRDELEDVWKRLASFSGFPEPFLKANPMAYRRWSTAYHRQLIREDIRDLTDVKDISDMEILFALLPSKVAAPLSIPSLATDLRVSYNTVKNRLDIFERFFLTFSLTPWTKQIARAIHKERKLYLFDYAGIKNNGAKFENMIALELFRAVNNWNDMGRGIFGLHYIRTKEGREVDFLISENGNPMLLIEAKCGSGKLSPNLQRFSASLGVPGIQLLDQANGFKLFKHEKSPILIAPAAWWLPTLP